MASSDVVLAHSAFDALQVGRSAQIIVEDIFIVIITYRKASVRTTSQETKAKSARDLCFPLLFLRFLRNLLREFLQPLLPPLVFVDEEEESTEGRREEEE
ncbi:PREDICTED: uncharacterized protein LOC106297338 isoform X3 [Brassica oleracea var. oleracea]|uniref:uncharacterized protein LOC106297338 isoform X3 n=1 Tax=Brassica oleracea var. oleracea TaxID=109376 RepID=UPI0006A71E26|nr:PREDICTED: uncharacterized protein LOC106297338 isoform X3 [Brassica oleracea var. oleracea]